MAKQKIASLPQDRTTASKPPFTYTEVDYFGPFEVQQGKTVRCLIYLFEIHAIHLEIASSLDTG